MESYLNSFYQFLRNSDKSPTINDTVQYISTTRMDISAILEMYENEIDIPTILELINSSKFHQGHNKNEKRILLLGFFCVLHDYSKNLLLKFDFYSSQSIQQTNPYIKDYLAFIPNYEKYLINLLGYYFNEDSKEWVIKDNFSEQLKSKYASVCILCGHAHLILSSMNLENVVSEENEYDPNEKCDENINPEESTWKCDQCSLTNQNKDITCLVCYTVRPVKTLKSADPKLKSNQWECVNCSLINDNQFLNCDACGGARKINEKSTGGDSSQNNILNPIMMNEISNGKVSECYDKDIVIRSRGSEVSRVSVLNSTKPSSIDNSSDDHDVQPVKTLKSADPKLKSNQWECMNCSLINDNKFLNCNACDGARKINEKSVGGDLLQNSILNPIMMDEMSNGKVSECYDKDIVIRSRGSEISRVSVLNSTKPNSIDNSSEQWICEKCTFLNAHGIRACEVCFSQRNNLETYEKLHDIDTHVKIINDKRATSLINSLHNNTNQEYSNCPRDSKDKKMLHGGNSIAIHEVNVMQTNKESTDTSDEDSSIKGKACQDDKQGIDYRVQSIPTGHIYNEPGEVYELSQSIKPSPIYNQLLSVNSIIEKRESGHKQTELQESISGDNKNEKRKQKEKKAQKSKIKPEKKKAQKSKIKPEKKKAQKSKGEPGETKDKRSCCVIL